eukprot:215173_1
MSDIDVNKEPVIQIAMTTQDTEKTDIVSINSGCSTIDSPSANEDGTLTGSPRSKSDKKCKEPASAGPCCYKALPSPFNYTTHLDYWTVDEEATTFWDLYGKKLATKNLCISIGNLLLAFAVWLIWSIVGVLLLNSWEETNGEYYHFSSWKADMTKAEYKATLWLLPATAGLSGATLRLTNSFMIAPSGGRNVISQTSILLLI